MLRCLQAGMLCPCPGQSAYFCTGASAGTAGGNHIPAPHPAGAQNMPTTVRMYCRSLSVTEHMFCPLHRHSRSPTLRNLFALMFHQTSPSIHHKIHHKKTCCPLSQMEKFNFSCSLVCCWFCPHHKCRSDSPEQHVYLLSQGGVERSSRTYWKTRAEAEK